MSNSVRNYKFSDAHLMLLVSNLVNTIRRDINLFEDYGIYDADVSAFEALGNSFEIFPPDIYYNSDVSVKVEVKRAAKQTVISMTRSIANRALLKWGANSPQFERFEIKGLMNFADLYMLSTARIAHSTASEMLSELSSEGLTQGILDNYASAIQQFEDAIESVRSAREIRDKKTRERKELGNELYGFVRKYTRIGQMIWLDVDESKFNDYLVYKKKGKKAEADEKKELD